MGNELQTVKQESQVSPETMEQVVAHGDLSKLTAAQRVEYYMSVCNSLGLNWKTRPFDYISLKGKLTLYTKKDATEQLRDIRRVSIPTLDYNLMGDVYVVTAHATMPNGRTDASTGAVFVGGLKGEDLANAFMKAETKAKRRVTLSICGLGWTDESEIDSIPAARPAQVNVETGEIVEPLKVTVVESQAPTQAPKADKPSNGSNGQHWTRTAEAGAFMKRMAEKTGLSYPTIQEAMGIKAITQYTGTVQEAEKAIDDWVYEQSKTDAKLESVTL